MLDFRELTRLGIIIMILINSKKKKVFFSIITVTKDSHLTLKKCIKLNKIIKIKAVVVMHNGGSVKYYKEFFNN